MDISKEENKVKFSVFTLLGFSNQPNLETLRKLCLKSTERLLVRLYWMKK